MKGTLLVALLGTALVAVSSMTLKSDNPNILVFVKEDGTVIEEDLSDATVQPRAVDINKLGFVLYQQSTKDEGYALKVCDANNIKNSGFDPNLPTKVIVHGYTNNGNSDSVQVPKNAYLESGKFNVIGVDYEPYNFPYISLVSNAKSLGEKIAVMLNCLAQHKGLQHSKVHIIGHSAGAHIAGYCGGYTSSKLGRITGLDPAGPLFGTNGVNGRLDSSDATYVDIIHSCIQSLGITYSIGHADFWPNGGKEQPRCGGGGLGELVGGCDHAQAYFFLADSIKTPGLFTSFKCKDDTEAKNRACTETTQAVMGEGSKDSSAEGIFFVDVHTLLQ